VHRLRGSDRVLLLQSGDAGNNTASYLPGDTLEVTFVPSIGKASGEEEFGGEHVYIAQGVLMWAVSSNIWC
jgi:hypothetical protein